MKTRTQKPWTLDYCIISESILSYLRVHMFIFISTSIIQLHIIITIFCFLFCFVGSILSFWCAFNLSPLISKLQIHSIISLLLSFSVFMLCLPLFPTSILYFNSSKKKKKSFLFLSHPPPPPPFYLYLTCLCLFVSPHFQVQFEIHTIFKFPFYFSFLLNVLFPSLHLLEGCPFPQNYSLCVLFLFFKVL